MDGQEFSFEYDPRKAATNLKKHGVPFDEGASVFLGDPSAYSDFDTDHSDDDPRFFTIGTSSSGKVLFIGHNESNGRIRLIPVRRATRRERRLYEESRIESR